MTTPAPGSSIGPTGRTRLITAAGTPHSFTGQRTSDARTAVTRGLAEYLESIIVKAEGGREHRFRRVFQTWAEPEDEAQYPAALVYSTQPCLYDASRFTPGISKDRRTADGRYIQQYADFVADLTVELWCTDPAERREMVFGCELALNPVSFMYGFVLELPHYFNQRAVYELRSLAYLDSEEDAMRRYRKAVFIVNAQLPVIQLHDYPEARPSIRLDEVGEHVIVNTIVETR